jgi:hypothetical protein
MSHLLTIIGTDEIISQTKRKLKDPGTPFLLENDDLDMGKYAKIALYTGQQAGPFERPSTNPSNHHLVTGVSNAAHIVEFNRSKDTLYISQFGKWENSFFRSIPKELKNALQAAKRYLQPIPRSMKVKEYPGYLTDLSTVTGEGLVFVANTITIGYDNVARRIADEIDLSLI